MAKIFLVCIVLVGIAVVADCQFFNFGGAPQRRNQPGRAPEVIDSVTGLVTGIIGTTFNGVASIRGKRPNNGGWGQQQAGNGGGWGQQQAGNGGGWGQQQAGNGGGWGQQQASTGRGQSNGGGWGQSNGGRWGQSNGRGWNR